MAWLACTDAGIHPANRSGRDEGNGQVFPNAQVSANWHAIVRKRRLSVHLALFGKLQFRQS
ncbi:MAG: hypothetical protein ACK43N_15235, partial [Pirellulaceae bacterium]